MKLTFLGDIFPAERVYTVGFGIKTKSEKGYGKTWINNIKEVYSNSDFVIGNLESPLIDDSLAIKKSFYGNPNFSQFLKAVGVNIVNVANNHILEHGKAGYRQTVSLLNKTGIDVIGDNNKPHYILKDNVKIGIAGFSNVDLDFFENDNCFSELTIEKAIVTVNEMDANDVDIKFFCFHWGNEYIHKPALWQRELAYKLIDAGVDMIIGHHPHVIQPYEKYNGGHIFYSLGNFCFDNSFQSGQFSKGMVVDMEINSDKKIGKIGFSGVYLREDDLVKKMPQKKFEKYFAKIQCDYHKVKDMSSYDRIYRSELKRRHLRERILMKLSWIPLWLSLSARNRKLMFNNIRDMYK